MRLGGASTVEEELTRPQIHSQGWIATGVHGAQRFCGNSLVVSAPLRKTTLPRPEARLALGRELRVSPLCLGMVRDPRTVPAAFDAGVNFFFFTADMHWPLYEPLREGLAMLLRRRPSVRDDIVVAVVSYVTQPEFCTVPFQEALDAVPRLRHIDVSVMGGCYADNFAGRLDRYRTHRTGGFGPPTRVLGASFHDRPTAARALTERIVDVGFARYNAAHPGAEVDLFPPVLAARGRASRPLLYGFSSTSGWASPVRLDEAGLPADNWRPAITDHYRFALTPRAVDGLLCAPANPKELRTLIDALSEGPLSQDECGYLRTLGDLKAGRARFRQLA